MKVCIDVICGACMFVCTGTPRNGCIYTAMSYNFVHCNLRMQACVCEYVCMYACTYVCMQCEYVQETEGMCVCTHVCMNVCNVCIHACKYISQTHVRVFVPMHICILQARRHDSFQKTLCLLTASERCHAVLHMHASSLPRRGAASRPAKVQPIKMAVAQCT